MGYTSVKPGYRSHRLVVVRRSVFKTKDGGLWWVQCDCGEFLLKSTSAISQNEAKSCGCILRQIRREGGARKRHRHYGRWVSMISRCSDPKNANYKNYGGRGITVCKEWRDNFWVFVKDIGDPPTEQHSLDRINNDGNYEPNNVRWATQKQQRNNTRKVRWLTLNGVTKNISTWGAEINICPSQIRRRIEKKRWSVERALTTSKIHKGIALAGVTKSIRAWSRDTGIPRSTLRQRLKQMELDKALSQPYVRKKPRGPITYNGQTKSLTRWAQSLGIKESTLRYRLERWGTEKALTTPRQKYTPPPT